MSFDASTIIYASLAAVMDVVQAAREEPLSQTAVRLEPADAPGDLGISSSLLTSRLKRMVGAGLLERRQYQANPARHEYLLTELGRSLRPVVVVLAAWGNARLVPGERSMVLVDAQTGAEAEPVVIDRATGRRVDGPDFVFTVGPAASRPFQDRYAAHPKPRQP